MNLIVAVDREWGIGNGGELLARVRADLKNFRRLTEGKVVVYGYNTLATFPGGAALKKRTNIVLTRKKDFEREGIIKASSIEELLEILSSYNDEDIFIIGGESVYRQMLPYCSCAYVTLFDHSFEKDAFMENLDLMDDWSMVEKGETLYSDKESDSVDGMPFAFTVYRKNDQLHTNS